MNKYTKSMYKKYGVVYAVDFDGTLCNSAYPLILGPKKSMINFCKKVKARGDKLILWTCREDELLKDAIIFCKMYGLEFDAVNENLPHRVELFGTDPRKIGADYYIDDHARMPVIQIIRGFLRLP